MDTTTMTVSASAMGYDEYSARMAEIDAAIGRARGAGNRAEALRLDGEAARMWMGAEADAPLFTVTTTSTRTAAYAQGWGVEVTPIHAGEDYTDPDVVVDLDATVVEIEPAAVRLVGGVACVAVGPDAYVPVENFEPVTLDTDHTVYGSRWFPTEAQAQDYARDVEQRAAAIRSWFD